MKTTKKVISVIMSAVLLITSSNALYASDLAFNNKEIADLRADIKGITEQAVKNAETPYGDKVPSLKEIQRKSLEAAKKVKESSKEIKEWIQKFANEYYSKKDVVLEGPELYERVQEYMAQHEEELSGYTDKEKKQIALYTVFYDELDKLPAHFIGDCDSKNCNILYIISAVIIVPSMLGFLVGIASFGTEPLGFLVGLGGFALLIFIWHLFTSDTTSYFSSSIRDCEGKKFGERCDIVPEQVKKEFLADPFGAIEHFVTKSDESSVVYNLDLEGATMLNDAVDIIYYMPFFSQKDTMFEKVKTEDIRKMLYTKTMYWRQMSQKEQASYLHRLANKARRRYKED